MPRYIQIPEGQYLNEVIEGFQRKHRFPQIGGAIDGCHIPIITPQVHLADYYNRKGFYSVVLQAVVDHKYCFTDVCIGWLGRVHDARILDNSSLNTRAQVGTLFPLDKVEITNETRVPVLIIGDAAYPLFNWLMKPYPDNGRLTASQQNFNYKLSSTSMVVENAFGRLKGHWRCLLKCLDNSTCNASVIIAACCTLHNICKVHSEEFDEAWRPSCNDDDNNDPGSAVVNARAWGHNRGAAIRK